MKEQEMTTGKYAALTEACGGAINPETLTELYRRNSGEGGWESKLVRREYYEFMADLRALFAPK